MRVASIVGNRPQFVKAAPLSRALRAHGREVLVHSGQHYDPEMTDLFFDELGIPEPDHHLGIGHGTPAGQLAGMVAALEPLLAAEKPDVVLVYGDTTTTLAGALTAAKLALPVAHVEAGLRSFDRSMPEEQNRVVTDHLSELLFCPTDQAVRNLAREGVTDGVHMVGDVMYDAALLFAPVARARDTAAAVGAEGEYLLMTVHRAAATDTRAALEALVAVIDAARAPGRRLVFPVHPRTRHKLEAAGLWDRLAGLDGLLLAPPLGYLDFTSLLIGARGVLTDSGGVQKEASFHGVPCVTLRDTTEWTETVEAGVNRLTGMDAGRVADALARLEEPGARPDLYGDGRSAERIAAVLRDWSAARQIT